ncbi:hypothetical protein [uncultured Litoreibacter sp.]|uniref:hypothetical protein n=1 Tax=uncultured Litoreibacter sp. TaxID=1392394 RepID=UPI0026222CEB|nr:hypothetical protein [uncultured Litoreibacter sp.]
MFKYILLSLAMMTTAVLGQSFDKRFSEVAVGTTFHYERNNGRDYSLTYLGKSGKYHRVRKESVKENFIRTYVYNAQGRLHSIKYDNSYTVRFSTKCGDAIGECIYTYKGHPKYNGKWKKRYWYDGGNLLTSDTRINEDYNHVYKVEFTTGNFLKYEERVSGGTPRWTKLVRVTNK